MTFTAMEADFLLHRLTVADCIAESLTDHAEGETPATHFTYVAIMAAAHRLERDLMLQREIHTKDTPIEAAIMRDVVDGSTWLCNADENLTPARVRIERKAAHTAREKLARLYNWAEADLPEIPYG